IEQGPVPRCIEQSALVMLAVNFDKRVANLPQQADTHRLIVDEGPRPPVARLHAAPNEIAPGTEAVLPEDCPRGMSAIHIENGRDAALLRTEPDKPRIGPRADGKSQRIEKNGLARARLARQRAQPALKREVQPIDKHNVADR